MAWASHGAPFCKIGLAATIESDYLQSAEEKLQMKIQHFLNIYCLHLFMLSFSAFYLRTSLLRSLRLIWINFSSACYESFFSLTR